MTSFLIDKSFLIVLIITMLSQIIFSKGIKSKLKQYKTWLIIHKKVLILLVINVTALAMFAGGVSLHSKLGKNFVAATLSCHIEGSDTCTVGTAVLHMNSDTGEYDNAHAQLATSATPYSNTLCCNDTNSITHTSHTTVGTICGSSPTEGPAFLNLSAETNAHVQAPNGTTAAYSIPACISGSNYTNCTISLDGCEQNYTFEPPTYDANETCLVGIYSDGSDNTTNAHVKGCSPTWNLTEVCCRWNTAPNNVTDDYFLEPFHGNATLANRTVTFQWLNTTDIDAEHPLIPNVYPMTYHIQVKQCGGSVPSSCIPDEVDFSSFLGDGEFEVEGVTEGTNITEYTPEGEDIFAVDTNYTWRVRANDGLDYGPWSENWTFYIPSIVTLTLFDENVSFGSMLPNEQNDTRNNDPFPFRIRNDGNCLVDINITVNTTDDWLWDRYQTASSYLQYMIDNATAYTSPDGIHTEENGSFNWSASATYPSWNNLPLTNYSANIRQLNHSDVTDEARIDINITVPSDEPAGDKGSMITISAWVSV